MRSALYTFSKQLIIIAHYMWRQKRMVIVLGLVCVFGIVCIYHNANKTPGGQIIFVKKVWPNNEGVYISDPDGNYVERLTSLSCVGAPIVSPVWSPDGDRIAFGCKMGGYNLCIMERVGLWQDCSKCNRLIDPAKVPEEFCDDPFSDITKYSVSWSPNGQQLAFTCAYQNTDVLICTINVDDREINCWPVSTIDPRGVNTEYDSASVVWSPVTDRLAVSFRRFGDEEGNIYLVDLNGTNSLFLMKGRNPEWSQDGKWLIFFQGGEIFASDVEKKTFQLLYDSPSLPFPIEEDLDKAPLIFWDSMAAWSPDGRYIAFSAARNTSGGLTALYIMNLRSKEIKRITELYDGYFSQPDWSP